MAPLFSLPGRRGRQEPADAPADAGGAVNPPPPVIPPAGVLRRERRALVRAREQRIRDLGGLVLEMYRRDRFREDLLSEQCAELMGLEARLHEIDTLLAAARGGGPVPVARCACGAPIVWGSHFCANCGRPAGEVPVVVCARCGHPLPADARFCVSCGTETSVAAGLGNGDAVVGADAEPASVAEHPRRGAWER